MRVVLVVMAVLAGLSSCKEQKEPAAGACEELVELGIARKCAEKKDGLLPPRREDNVFKSAWEFEYAHGTTVNDSKLGKIVPMGAVYHCSDDGQLQGLLETQKQTASMGVGAAHYMVNKKKRIAVFLPRTEPESVAASDIEIIRKRLAP